MKIVVGAAVIRSGRVLAARRTSPAHLAGRWELPGGKVEPGEQPGEALLRELREEFGVDVEITSWLATTPQISDTTQLRVALVRIVSGEPEPTEHDQIRWLTADEVSDPDLIDWLDSDRELLPELAHALRTVAATELRAIFFDAEAADAVRTRLIAAGYDAHVARERLSGEDDDEDHPWAVVTDAPDFAVELLVDEYDGWIDAGQGAEQNTTPPPLQLPTAPRRIKRPS